MKRGSIYATLLAVGAMVLTPAVAYAEKTPAERGAEDKAAAEKAHLDKLIRAQEAADFRTVASATPDAAPKPAETAHPADAPVAPPAPSAAVAPPTDKPATDLNLRPPHALEPAAPAPTLGLGTKVGLAALIGAAAFFVYRRRAQKKPTKQSSLRVTARASIGTRTEVCIVEVDGQRLLLGVTPSSIRTLTALTDEPMIERDAEPSPVEESLARLFASAKRDAAADEDDREPIPSNRTSMISERGMTSIRGGRATQLETARSNASNDASRNEASKSNPSPRRQPARKANAAVEGQVSGLLAARNSRS